MSHDIRTLVFTYSILPEPYNYFTCLLVISFAVNRVTCDFSDPEPANF